VSENASLVWFRQDLRVEDNPALAAALERGGPVVPVFVWSPEEEGAWAPASASRWWLHQSLKALADDLHRLGARLVLRHGEALPELLAAARQAGARAVFWNRRYEPAVIARDARVKEALRKEGLAAESFNGALLFEPWQVQTKQKKPFQVYTPFWKACLALPPPAGPLAAPERLPAPARQPASVALEKLGLEPTIDWAAGMRKAWAPGTAGAHRRLDRLLGVVGRYADDRDRPGLEGTSSLSPHLHFGEISPHTVWRRVVQEGGGQARALPRGAETYLKELVWREFAYHLLYHFPDTTDRPLRPEFSAFPWRDDPAGLRAWQRGRTGYPLVDAGMRQLWATGWMHNRVRMVTGSFLVKDLLLPWQAGAKWFYDTLVDADLASNTLGWQWVAGCGADAAPYFRVFNPVTQAEKFDPEGEYVRRWVPELAKLPAEAIHQPWAADAGVLAAAGVRLGENYPRPIVDHAEARERALAALAKVTKSSG
jgi:deoxyribodipyrimidine photo-lyase